MPKEDYNRPMTSLAEYQSRLLAYTQGQDPAAMQKETPAIVAELIRGIPAEKLAKSPAPGKWSVIQIIAHLAEDELVTSWRYRQMLENPGVALPGFDQDLWAKLGAYNTWTADDALAMFKSLRDANLRMTSQLTPEQWESGGVHGERGPMTVRSLFRHMAGHDRNHVEQIARILGKS
jgi:hypothetical protein